MTGATALRGAREQQCGRCHLQLRGQGRASHGSTHHGVCQVNMLEISYFENMALVSLERLNLKTVFNS